MDDNRTRTEDGYGEERVLRDLRSLSIPRRTGRPGERAAIDYLSRAYRSIDLPLSVEPFEFSAFPNEIGLRAVPVALWILLLAAMWLRVDYPAIALVLFLILFSLSIPGWRWIRAIERLYDFPFLKRRSANLVAVLKPEHVVGRLVLMAHYDTKSQSFPIYLRMIIQTSFTVGLFGIALLYLTFSLTGLRDWILYLWLPVLLLSIPCFLIVFNFSGDESPGAVDNATGLALLIELARNLKAAGTKGIEVVFLMTGAEEEGLAGAIRFIQGRGREYGHHNTYFVNLDGIGSPGGLILSSRYGLPPVRTGGRLEGVLTKVAREAEIPVHNRYFPVSPGLDHIPVASHGFRAVSLTGSDFGRATFSIHTPGDLPENVDPEVLRDGYRLLYRLVRELEEGVSHG